MKQKFDKDLEMNQMPKEEQYYKLGKLAFKMKNFQASKSIVNMGLQVHQSMQTY